MAAWLGGSHGQPDELRGPGAAGAEEEGQAGGAPRADGRGRAMGQVARPGGPRLPFPGARQNHAPRSRCPARGGGDHDAGRPHRGRRLHRGAGLHEGQGPRAAPRRTSPGRAGTGISDSRAHIGVDAGSGLVHAAEATAANVSGASAAHAPVREGGASCRAGPGHTGVAERPEVASGPHPSPVRRTTARKPSAIEGLDCALPAERGIESRKASVRSGAEHPSLIAKRRSGRLKTRCRGVRKSSCMPCVSFAPADPAVRIPAGRSLASRPEAA